MRARLGATACVLLLAVSCGSGSDKAAAPAARSATAAPPWTPPPDPIKRIIEAGLQPAPHEFLLVHRHAHLDVFVDARRVRVPGGIGIQIHDPGVQTGQAGDGTPVYGGIEECDQPCISPLHTHSDDGILHTESTNARPNRLGQFFVEWNVRLTPRCVGSFCEPAERIRVYVDGRRFSGDPRSIPLNDQEEIAIVIGQAPTSIPSHFAGG
jgi:hypothetical protein